MSLLCTVKYTRATTLLFSPLCHSRRYRHSRLYIPKLERKNAVKLAGRTWRTPFWDMRGKAPHLAESLEQKLSRRTKAAQIPKDLRINIGLPRQVQEVSRRTWKSMVRKNRQNAELEEKARLKQLKVPLSEVNDEWLESSDGLSQVYEIGEHYGIYRDLFGIKAYFNAAVHLQAFYPTQSSDGEDDEVTPVYYGNIVMPEETKEMPIIEYESDMDTALWTLVLSNLDGHLLEQDKQYLHWLIVNIPGNKIDQGQELCDYLQCFPAKGSGYHRMVFVLFRQEKEITDPGTVYDKPCLSLQQRTFSMKDFYTKHEDNITPAGFCFYQTKWDDSVSRVYHHALNMREPVYDYIHKPTYVPMQTPYPAEDLTAFNLYLNQYRDPKEMKKQILKKRLKNISPFQPEAKPMKYPGIFKLDTKSLPSWYRDEIKKEREGLGIYKGLDDPFALDEDWEVTHYHPHLHTYEKPWEKAEKYKVPEIWTPDKKSSTANE